MEKYTRTIPANSSTPINAEGNYVYCEDATGVFFINVPGAKTYEMKAKRTYRLKVPLKNFELQNNTASPVTVEIIIGSDEVEDNSVNLDSDVTVQGDVQVINSPGTQLTVTDHNAHILVQSETSAVVVNATNAVTIINGSANQTGGIIQNLGPDECFLGAATTTANVVANGIRLMPGQMYTYEGPYRINAAVMAGRTANIRYKRLGRV